MSPVWQLVTAFCFFADVAASVHVLARPSRLSCCSHLIVTVAVVKPLRINLRQAPAKTNLSPHELALGGVGCSVPFFDLAQCCRMR